MNKYWTEEKIKSAKYNELKKRCEEAEGELAIIKGIGNKSPEMSALQKENHELAKINDIIREEAQVIQLQAENEVRKYLKRIADLEIINKSHQELNGKLREELANSKDLVKTYRKAGIL